MKRFLFCGGIFGLIVCLTTLCIKAGEFLGSWFTLTAIILLVTGLLYLARWIDAHSEKD